MRRAWWVWSAVALVVVADGAASARAADSARNAEVAQASAPAGAGMAALDALPWAERVGLEQAMAAADARYSPRMDETGPRLDVSGARFSSRGAHVDVAGHALTLRASRMGRGELRSLPSASPSIVGPEVQTNRGAGVTEWWRSLPSGLEHGVTIAERPAGEGELVIEVAVEGLTARGLSSDAVELVDASDNRVATYAHLVVLDADGVHVPARMGVRDGRIAIAVNDEGARYPLVVDPLLAIAGGDTLTVSDEPANVSFGWSVALTSNGDRALISSPLYGSSNPGSVRVFLRTGSTWAEEATLSASDGVAGDGFGVSVALAADGSRALIGVPSDDTAGGVDAGSARVFLRTGTSWTAEAMLVASGGATQDYFGGAVALTADGMRALVGADNDDTNGNDSGSARVFSRDSGTWVEEATLLASDGTADDHFGRSVALSSDGSRALVGATEGSMAPDLRNGSARVFLRTGTSWMEEATFRTSDGVLVDRFGNSVALSSDGSRALVGAYHDDTPAGSNAGSAHVYVRTGTTWAEEAMLLPSGGAANEEFGYAVALSADGSRALIGTPRDRTVVGAGAGSARMFLRTGTSWTEVETMLVASGGAMRDYFGSSVALSSDGGHAIVGTSPDRSMPMSLPGSARVFTILPASPDGAACSVGGTCLSGHCIDGVCCESACAGGLTDCQACSAALTGGASGVCAPLSAAAASMVTCRASAGGCDPAEVCSSSSAACPADFVQPVGVVCRPVASECDTAEACTGGVACPVNAPAPSGLVCRPSTASCDVIEACDGSSYACPGDTFLPAGSVCGTGMGDCSLPTSCTGTAPNCPTDAGVRAAGTPCRDATGPCDVDDVCDGTSGMCVDRFAPVTVACGMAPMGVCDAPDHCAGTSGDCVDTFLADVECRASAGGCDLAELCTGDVATCPPDQVSPSGTVCRASTELSCDPLESCDGTASSCPADITTCERSDGGGPVDGGGADAGAPVAAAGCACRAASGPSLPSLLGLGLLALGLGVRRRR